jgi:gamma-glutamylputrescine oxidase
MAALAATVIGEAVIGDARRFDRISALPTPPFPGGTVLRQPLQVAGMMWYALRDRFP